VGGMSYEMKNVIFSHFSNLFSSFAPRTCNKVAHALAAQGLRSQVLIPGGRAHRLLYSILWPVI
jgi:hypothetical protein